MIEQQILAGVMHDESFARKVLPFLKAEYFREDGSKVVLGLIDEYLTEYNKLPKLTALQIDLANKQGLNQSDFDSAVTFLESVAEPFDVDKEWLCDQTEEFCQERAVYNAIMSSVKIMDDKDSQQTRGAIPKLLQDALGISFDNAIGHDYIADADARFEYYHRAEERVPFDIEYLNRITRGGLPRKTLNVLMAGCVHPDTKVRIKSMGMTGDVAISELEELLNLKCKIEVDSPDGFVPVNFYVDKGIWDEYILSTPLGEVRVNENHLFETKHGWQYAKDLVGVEDARFFSVDGLIEGAVTKTGNRIPIVDINVEHENHRYYTDGISSHNTGVGKTLAMCHFAASNMAAGKNVLYITMEMSEERISERIDCNLLDVTIEELEELPKVSFDKKIARLKEKTLGRLIVKEFPTSAVGAPHFRHLLNELVVKQNFNPDIIYIDYLNICASARVKLGNSINSYSVIKAIAEELRALAVEFNVPIVSATQTNRGGQSSSDIDIADTSESHGLPMTVDFFLALMVNEELLALNQILFKQLKNRYRDVYKDERFVLGVERTKFRLYDVESSAQHNIARNTKTETSKPSPTLPTNRHAGTKVGRTLVGNGGPKPEFNFG